MIQALSVDRKPANGGNQTPTMRELVLKIIRLIKSNPWPYMSCGQTSQQN